MAEPGWTEEVVGLRCDGAQLWGVLTRPGAGAMPAGSAVLIVVGGPQYRVGSHRQFVLLARSLARQGIPALRFDYRGMGDSEGPQLTFEAAGPDLRCAIEALAQACPQCPRIVVWGLCDAASAALMFATGDARIAGIVAANPWARSEATLAATQVRHYYGARLLQRDFWAKLARGGIDWRGSIGALFGVLHRARRRRAAAPEGGAVSFQTAMARGLAGFRGRVLLVLSGNDLTAKEFLQYAGTDAAWKGLLQHPKVDRLDVADADHTYSRRVWSSRVEQETIAWVLSLGASPANLAAHRARHNQETSEGA